MFGQRGAPTASPRYSECLRGCAELSVRGALGGLEQRVQLVKRTAALGANQEGHWQAVGAVEDQHCRQWLARSSVAQLAVSM
jgi:hypothetical protein